jgi:D-aspartate ligase
VSNRPAAYVMGDMDLLTPIGRAGIPCVAVSPHGAPPSSSRYARSHIDTAETWQAPEEMVDRLVQHAAGAQERPVLFYQGDADQLMVSRFRDRLAPTFRFVIADAELCEDLVDKARFVELSERTGLDVPATFVLQPGMALPPASALRFPLIAKPTLRRTSDWKPIAGAAKAVRILSVEALDELWTSLQPLGTGLVVQELVEGPETAIESYHVYVDAAGKVAGEFTGRKIRTRPASFGISSAVEVIDIPEVRRAGRDVLDRTGLTGVAKLDFKRSGDGRLRLLEINARFNLWHYPGAIGGVDLPALVYADLVGEPRPAVRQIVRPVRWVKPWHDVRAAREAGVPLLAWVLFAARCPAKSAMSWRDPMAAIAAVRYGVQRRNDDPV